jgi:hypothetical protein
MRVTGRDMQRLQGALDALVSRNPITSFNFNRLSDVHEDFYPSAPNHMTQFSFGHG